MLVAAYRVLSEVAESTFERRLEAVDCWKWREKTGWKNERKMSWAPLLLC
jgi:hypothetical protein